MITRDFELAENDEYGFDGLRPLWMPGHQCDPLQGMGTAHDVLEHGRNDRVEWQGLGGSVYVRSVPGYFSMRGAGNPDPVENLAAEFESLFRLWDRSWLPDPGPCQRLRDEEAEHIIVEAVRVGCAQLVDEMQYSSDEDVAAARKWGEPEQRRRMAAWMRLGYRACRRRWRGYRDWMLRDAFAAVEEQADRALRSHAGMHGLRLRLRLDIARCRATFDEVPGQW